MPRPDRSNTNPASTFHVLSVLHRLGYDARLSLGKARTLGVMIIQEDGRKVDVEVKGLAGKNPWPVDSVGEGRDDLYFAFVCFGGTIRDLDTSPEVWIIPSTALEPLIYDAPGGRRVVQYVTLEHEARSFRGAWHLLAGER